MLPGFMLRVIAKLVSIETDAVCVLLYLISKATRQSEISVLVYHSVGSTSSNYSVSTVEFQKQMDYLLENYRIVSLKEVSEFLEGKRELPRKSVAITFDDGYLDNYTIVYPYLKKHHLPMTIFLATDYVQKKMRLDDSFLPMLSWAEIEEMGRNNVCFGAHTSSHPDLLRMGIGSAEKEIRCSKEEIERRTGKVVNSFAYPSGRYNNNILDLVRRQGFHLAFGGGGHVRRNANKLAVHRVEVKRSTSLVMFKIRLTKALDWYIILRKPFSMIYRKVFSNSPLADLDKILEV